MNTHHEIPIINNGVTLEDSKIVNGQIGVIATKSFATGDLLFTVTGPIIPDRTIYTFQFSKDQHIDPRVDGKPGLGHYLNHSCEPNAKINIIRVNGNGYIQVIARKTITEGDELSVDYGAMEYELATNDPCTCGASNCRKKITGYKDLPEEIKKKYIEEGLIADYLLQLDKG